jgi:hypothetical protein
MSKVFVNVGLSLDGFMAPEGMTIEHWDEPQYRNWGAKWGAPVPTSYARGCSTDRSASSSLLGNLPAVATFAFRVGRTRSRST